MLASRRTSASERVCAYIFIPRNRGGPLSRGSPEVYTKLVEHFYSSAQSHNLTGIGPSASSGPVDLAFADNRLEQLCTRFIALRNQLGDRGAKAVAAHLACLRAASCLDEVRHLPGRCRERDGQLALGLPDGGRLIFEPAADPPPDNGDGGLDWEAVRSV